MQNKVLIIVGMHRSGTSLITGWLQKCGLEIGEYLLGSGSGNIEGHFEDVDFYNLHAEILTSNNFPDSGIIDDDVNYITPYFKEKINNIVSIRNSKFKQWGWKDPRTCLFLDTYREILPDAYYLIVLREYREVIISLANRSFTEFDKLYDTSKGYFSRLAWYYIRRKRYFKKFCQKNASFYLRVWIHYNENILKNIKVLPSGKFIVVNYTQLITKNDDIICDLKNNWDFKLTYFNFNQLFKKDLLSKNFDIENFIENKELIQRAENIENCLKSYIKN